MSGALSRIGSGLGAINTGISAVNKAEFAIGDALGALGFPISFGDQLQPASWRGLPFAVIGSRVRAGRRKAIHEYPFRDGVWVEDLGKRGRVYGFQGFVIGDDVADQIKALVAAVEAVGPGELVHPTFGSVQCELIAFDAADEWDAGGVWSFRIEFLEPVPRGMQLQPMSVTDTPAGVKAAADDAQAATKGGFLDTLKSGIGSGLNAVKQAVAAVRPYVATAGRLINDAGRLAGAVKTLSGLFGRYGSGRAAVQPGGVQGALRTARQVEGAVQGVVAVASGARLAVTRAGSILSGLVGL